ncbi:MAG: DUF4402 domain-containing protein [Bacteroidota bacterium]|nr:DUF4402 domain-containing protein [Bacteroidota bacterium]
MKKLTKISAIAILMIGYSFSSFAQASATASASATIIAPITITKTVDMNFGNAAVTSSLGTVVLATASTRTVSGGVTISSTTPGTVSAASFDITGEANYTYAITLPSTNQTITHTNTVNTMIVNTFVSNPATTGTLSVGGLQTLLVGATLNVVGTQLPGLYSTLTPFSVTVNYN